MDTKRCSRCGEVKALNEFHRNKNVKDGYRNICKKCRSEEEGIGYRQPVAEGLKKCSKCGLILPVTHEYFYTASQKKLASKCRDCSHKDYSVNRDRYIKTRREHWNKNASEINKKRREEYGKDPQKVLKRNKAWNDAHREDVRRQKREYYWSDEQRRERLKEYAKDKYWNNPEKSKNRVREWRQRKPDHIRLKTRIYKQRRDTRKHNLTHNFDQVDWQTCLGYWNFCCAICGSDEDLHMDHWIPLASEHCPGTIPENIVVLCEKCNCSKGNRNAEHWLNEKTAKDVAKRKLAEIETYFEYVKSLKKELG